jgi:hypothetical protein
MVMPGFHVEIFYHFDNADFPESIVLVPCCASCSCLMLKLGAHHCASEVSSMKLQPSGLLFKVLCSLFRGLKYTRRRS